MDGRVHCFLVSVVVRFRMSEEHAYHVSVLFAAGFCIP